MRTSVWLCSPLSGEDFNHRTRSRPRPISVPGRVTASRVMLACSHVAVDTSRLYSGFAYTIAARRSPHFRPAPTLTALRVSAHLAVGALRWALPPSHTGADAPLQAHVPPSGLGALNFLPAGFSESTNPHAAGAHTDDWHRAAAGPGRTRPVCREWEPQLS